MNMKIDINLHNLPEGVSPFSVYGRGKNYILYILLSFVDYDAYNE